MQKRSYNSFQGFTLIELLVVIAIIGLLTAVSFVTYSTVKMKGRDAKRSADTSTIEKALGLYQTRNEKYPIAPSGVCLTGDDDISKNKLNQDLQKMPTDPVAKDTAPTGTSPQCYFYTSDDGNTYTLQYYLEGERVQKTRTP